MGNPNGHYVHGLYYTKLYKVWATMKQRCNDPNCRGYRWYGAKGITYCREWEKVDAFYDWAMKHGYKDGLTLDRINPKGNYEPSNCRWITMSAQQSNRSDRHNLTYNGRTLSITEWSEILKIPRSTLSNRIRAGWSIERALGE